MNNRSSNTTNTENDPYQYFLGQYLSQDEGVLNAEQLSEITLYSLKFASRHRDWPGIKHLLKKTAQKLIREDDRLNQTLFGNQFKNPIGLAAGFDKNALAAGIWDRFGFGFAEMGTITRHAQPGNPKPRLFRLAKEKAALNRMGFNNLGAKKVLKILQEQNIQPPGTRPAIIGINLGKSKITPIEKAPEDYAFSLEVLAPLADYAVINISSPNTPGLRSLQEIPKFRKLITRLKSIRNCPPLLVKIAPDLNNEDIENLAKVAKDEQIAGIIAVNTSLNRLGLDKRRLSETGLTLEEEKGGLSGLPLKSRALEVIQRLHLIVGNDLPLIGVGGIDSPRAAWERVAAGASLIQIYTGWIFHGPKLVPSIIEGLLLQLERNGFNSIKDAIGCKEPWK